jgi:hypothetical protein
MKNINQTVKILIDKRLQFFTNKTSKSLRLLLLLIVLVPGFLNGAVKTSTVNGNWSSGSTWSPYGAPSSSDKVKIYHEVTLNQNYTASDTVFVYNTLNLSSGKILTLNPGKMILVNDATYDGRIGKVSSGANISGNFTFQKWITRCDGYSVYGSPFDVTTSNFDWYYCYQCQPSWSNLYYYDESSTGSYDNGYYDNIGGNIARGKGFFYWYSNYTGGQNFPRKISLNGNINFTNDFNFNVSYTSTNGNYTNDGYNLVSNPFPGTIDWLDSDWTKTNMSSVFYTWSSCANTYAAYVSGIGVNGGTRYIPSMQGFWVKATNTSPTLKVLSGAMVSNSQTLLRQNSADSVNNVLRLTLDNDEIAIHLDPASTSTLDSETDALKFFSPESKICSSTPLSDLDYAINSVDPGSQVIPIKVRGGGTLNFSGIATFFDKYAIYLRDLVSKNYLPVHEGMTYIFSDTSVTTFNERFEIHFKEKLIDTGIQQQFNDAVTVFSTGENIMIRVPEEFQPNLNVKIFDLLGKQLYFGTFSQPEILIPNLNTPVLVLIYNDKYSLAKKLL